MSDLIPPGFAEHQPIDPDSVWPGLNAYEAQRVRAVRDAVRVWCEQERVLNAAFPPVKKGLADAHA
ncbi:hypothetical protein [Dyella sp. LX-1]|uniref:hypothetical protein n=1 Tax=Dyella sp. LX-1 TaxID=2838831 RepID=UPI001BE0FB26|nr:hypothetical protein [Dyella sp. LX-1]MBT2119864.1 hypothetical protein [Dyella sp. LX-1]MBT2119875.1 hypothetical protein [Dyella sp. LX-1]